MAINEIAVDTGILASDIGELNQTLAGARRQLSAMMTSIKELDAMWDGPSNQEFVRQFEMDAESAKELFDTIDSIIKCMEYAKKEYDTCESQVESLISSINVG